MTDLRMQYTMEDIKRFQWIEQAARIYLQKVGDLPYVFALDLAEAIYDTYSDWNPADAVEEDLSYWNQEIEEWKAKNTK